MSEFWRQRVIDQLELGLSLEQIDRGTRAHQKPQRGRSRRALAAGVGRAATRKAALRPARPRPAGPRDRSRPAAVRPSSTVDPIAAALELAQAETGMDVAVLGEIRGGREVVRFVAGDGSFGLTPGASMMIEDTYCHRLLTGRLSNIVPDTNADDQLRELPITHAAPVGAYIGVPLTTIDARLYVLCCLAHERRPQLSKRDVLFLRGLAETIVAELEQRQTQHTDDPDPTPAR